VFGVAGQRPIDDRDLQIKLTRQIRKRAQVFREARTAKREPGFQIGLGKIELGVQTEDVHQQVAVDATCAADRPDLIAKGNLDSVERVVGVLDQLRRTQVAVDHRGFNVGVDAGYKGARFAVEFTDHSAGRSPVVRNCGTFSKKLGVVGYGVATAAGLAGGELKRRNRHGLDGSRQHGASKDHHVERVLVTQRLADVITYSANKRKVEAAIVGTRCTNADE